MVSRINELTCKLFHRKRKRKPDVKLNRKKAQKSTEQAENIPRNVCVFLCLFVASGKLDMFEASTVTRRCFNNSSLGKIMNRILLVSLLVGTGLWLAATASAKEGLQDRRQSYVSS